MNTAMSIRTQETSVTHERCELSGVITHVFYHRFVVQTAKGAVLADLTPDGADLVTLRVGAHVTLEAEKKPSEFKVTRFTCSGGSVVIEHKKKHHHGHDHRGSEMAIKAVRTAGFAPVGEPRRKPKHFGVLGLSNGRHSELHIELDGRVRKIKPAYLHKCSEVLPPV
jgi:hypothetical protein